VLMKRMYHYSRRTSTEKFVPISQ